MGATGKRKVSFQDSILSFSNNNDFCRERESQRPRCRAKETCKNVPLQPYQSETNSWTPEPQLTLDDAP